MRNHGVADIEIYTTPFCPFCAAAKKLLDEKGVAYTEIDVMMKSGLLPLLKMLLKPKGCWPYCLMNNGDKSLGSGLP